MTEDDFRRIGERLVEAGLKGMPEPQVLHRFCEDALAAGVPLSRGLLLLDTLHPIYEGRAFRWRNDGVAEAPSVEYGDTSEGEAAAEWQQSTFHHLVESGGTELRRRLRPTDALDFRLLPQLRDGGQTDYLAFVHRLDEEPIGGMDCVYSHWMTRQAAGFDETHLAALRRLVPILALAVKCASLARIARTLAETYLGRDAARSVLGGSISRGVTQKIRAVLWFSDLRSYTRITDTSPPEEILPLLNDYADAVISSVHAAGGDVMKLIGDGTLAIFPADDAGLACRSALRAEADLRRRLAALSARRHAEGRPVTEIKLGLHLGEVFYGNIGSRDRLDFTVIGPAVNEVSRIVSLCQSVDRSVLVSAAFQAATPQAERAALVSVGRYALRGVGRAQDLFTLDPVTLDPGPA